jgi:hypothetical protein
MAQSAAQSGQGNKARLLRGVLAQLDQSLENASEGFFQANRNFAQASRDIEAVQAGRQAATRGRSEDLIPAHQALRPEAQAAFRAGYVDPLIAQTRGAAFGVNKARPFLNDAFRDEAAAMAPGNSLMQRRLAGQQTMFERRGHALGGSRTMDNMNDHDALAVDPVAATTAIGHGISGNVHGLLSSLSTPASDGSTRGLLTE